MRNFLRLGVGLAFLVIVTQCSSPEPEVQQTLFQKVSADSSGINFINKLSFDQKFNIYTYRNFYNGGGVGIGDINNDGLVDIYFNANQGKNKLYLNRGNFKFEDITDRAGVAGTKAWSTGVAMADVNGDGWLDIYVCNSGDVEGDNKENELFINNGDLTFTDRAKEYGVADKGFTTHAVFFDYDRDGDLDLYILNNSYQAIGSFNLRKNERPKRDALGGDKLMRNDGNRFTDVSVQAGIYGSVIGFGLGATVGDINKDGWPDIYVSNDFFERDYLYINNQDGTFKECLTDQMKSISGASMGADLADINNDGWPDIFVTEMLPEPNERLKTVTTFENWDRYQNNVLNDYYHQFTRNMLQLNNGNNTFSEVGRLTGMEATDWSWGALMFDMDNDGLKDVFVANGIYQDLTNQDYLQYVSSQEVVRSIVSNNQVDYKKLVELIPSTPVPDYAFQNLGDLKFVNRAKEWGLDEPNFSNGAAYGDLDNDGDLDLVINRVNEQATIVRNVNNIISPKHRYLKFELSGNGKNTFAVGASIIIEAKGKRFYIEHVPNRGFESSVDHRPNIGLGQIDTVDQVIVQWPLGAQTVLKNVATNQVLRLKELDGVLPSEKASAIKTWFQLSNSSGLLVKHTESDFVDFDRDKLVYIMQSNEGPRVSVADVNNDGYEDFYISGAKESAGQLMIQQPNGSFRKTNESVWMIDRLSEDTDSDFFDADGDGDFDLYVCSGSNEFSNVSNVLNDRLYFNDGKGNFTRSDQALPTTRLENSSTVSSGDYDGDGDLDLFVGIRSESFGYGKPMNGYVLNNDGNGKFTDVTNKIAPQLLKCGMITDGEWIDINQDSRIDLIVVGEYMPIKIYLNDGSKLNEILDSGLNQTNGWWNALEAADLDQDGDVDFVVANHGLNSRFRASAKEPLTMWVNDFDRNGSIEQIICTYHDGVSYPMVLRHDLMSQIPALKKKYLKYENYKDQKIDNIFSPAELESALKLEAYEFSTGIVLNQGNGKFIFKSLPREAQLSMMYAIKVFDFNHDGHPDILLGGNQYRVKPEIGRFDGSYGVVLQGDGKGNFSALSPQQSGLVIHGEIRDFKIIQVGKEKLLLVARNNDTVLLYKF